MLAAFHKQLQKRLIDDSILIKEAKEVLIYLHEESIEMLEKEKTYYEIPSFSKTILEHLSRRNHSKKLTLEELIQATSYVARVMSCVSLEEQMINKLNLLKMTSLLNKRKNWLTP